LAQANGRAAPSDLQLAQEYQSNGGLVYMRSFFESAAVRASTNRCHHSHPPQFEAASKECAQLRGRLRSERSAIAVGRLGAYLPARAARAPQNALTPLQPECLLARLFAAPSVAARLSAVTGQALSLSDYPLELRLYGPGAGMAWHRDEQLFAVPQVELVLTLWNSSDSATEWQDAAGRLRSQRTESNSVLALRALGPHHRVLPVARGERAIVKVVFSATRERTPAFLANLLGTYEAHGSERAGSVAALHEESS